MSPQPLGCGQPGVAGQRRELERERSPELVDAGDRLALEQRARRRRARPLERVIDEPLLDAVREDVLELPRRRGVVEDRGVVRTSPDRADVAGEVAREVRRLPVEVAQERGPQPRRRECHQQVRVVRQVDEGVQVDGEEPPRSLDRGDDAVGRLPRRRQQVPSADRTHRDHLHRAGGDEAREARHASAAFATRVPIRCPRIHTRARPRLGHASDRRPIRVRTSDVAPTEGTGHREVHRTSEREVHRTSEREVHRTARCAARPHARRQTRAVSGCQGRRPRRN